jgi:hypothetical protein
VAAGPGLCWAFRAPQKPTLASTHGSYVYETPSWLDRAPDYESGGQEFESLAARQLDQKLSMILPLDPGAIR